jgi:putative oxidoreductase
VTLRSGDVSLLILRLAAGIVMFPHGAQKLLGWFGGPGFAGTMHYFTSVMHIPAPLAFLSICTEFFAPILLVFGVLTRLAAVGFAIDMIVAVLTTHIANGFFMNWTGQQKGEGFEYHIYAVAVALALLISGAGRYSLDALFAGKRKAQFEIATAR